MAPRRPNPVERDRSTPTIVTRTSSVRAVVGDDGVIITQLQSTGISRTNKPGVPRILRALRGQFLVTWGGNFRPRTREMVIDPAPPTEAFPAKAGTQVFARAKVRVGPQLSLGMDGESAAADEGFASGRGATAAAVGA